MNTYPTLRSSRHLRSARSMVEPTNKRPRTYCIAYHPRPCRIAYACHVAHPPDLVQQPRSSVPCNPENNECKIRKSIPSVMKNCESFEFFVPPFAIATSPRWVNRNRGWISSSKGSGRGEGAIIHCCVCVSAETRSRTTVEGLSARTTTRSVSSLDEETRNDPGLQGKERTSSAGCTGIWFLTCEK